MSRRIVIDDGNIGGDIAGLHHRFAFKDEALNPDVWSRSLRWCEANVAGDWGAYIGGMLGLTATDIRFSEEADARAYEAKFPVERLQGKPHPKGPLIARMERIEAASGNEREGRASVMSHIFGGAI